MHFVRIFQDRYFLCFQTLKRFFAYCSFPSPHDVDKARKLPSLPTNHHRRGMLPRTPLGDRIEPTTALQIAMSLYTHSPTLTLLLQLISTTLMSSISSFPPFTARPDNWRWRITLGTLNVKSTSEASEKKLTNTI